MITSFDQHTHLLEYFPSEDGRIAYLDQGNGPVILFLHGVPTSSWLYRKIWPSITAKGFRVIVPDMLGFGMSDKPESYDTYSASNTGKRLHELMNYLKIETWTHVFHDGGGLWTWEMLSQDASKVSRLIMLNSIVYQQGFKPPLTFIKGLLSKFYTKLYSSSWGQRLVINGTFRSGIKNRKVINPNMLKGYKKPLLKNGNRALFYFFSQTGAPLKDYSALHTSLKMPVTVIWGIHDSILKWNKLKNMVSANFNVKEDDIHILDAKHFIQEEVPEIVIEKILRSLSKDNTPLSA